MERQQMDDYHTCTCLPTVGIGLIINDGEVSNIDDDA